MAESDTSVTATLREQVRVHVRSIIPIGAVVAVGVVAVGLLIGAYALVLGRVAYQQLVEWASAPETFAAATLVIVAPMLLLCVLASLVWAGTAVQLANAAATKRRVSTLDAALVALRRSPRAAAIAVVVPLVFVLAVLAAPILVLVGLVGLVLNRVKPRWSTRRLVILAVPFATAVVLLVRWSLALPSVWLAGTTIRGSLADSAARTAGRAPLVAVVLLLSGFVSIGTTEGLVALVGLLQLGAYTEFLTRLVAIILVGPLLPVALALQYRAGGDVPPTAPGVAATVSRRARVATVVVASLVIPLAIGVSPAPAAAVGAAAAAVIISTVETQPLSTTAATTVNVSVTNPLTAEGEQPTGSVRIYIDNTELSGSPYAILGAGSVVAVQHTFSDGSHDIRAEYDGDVNYSAQTTTVTVTAAAPPPDSIFTTTDLTITPGGTSAPGTALNAHVAVTQNSGPVTPTGRVELFHDGDATPFTSGDLVAGVVDLPLTLPPGTNLVLAKYVPDAGFYASQHSVHKAISKYVSTVTLDQDSTDTVFGQPVQFSATVSAGSTPTGSVRFETSTATVLGTESVNSSGIAVLSIGSLPVGDTDVIAYYEGDAAVATGSSSSLTHTVDKAATVVEVTSSATSPAVGTLTSITVTVTAEAPGAGTPSGTATVYRDGVDVGTVTLTAGTGTLHNVAVGDAGNRVFSADYNGDASFENGSGTGSLVVGKADTQTRLLTIPGSAFTYGSSQTYSGNVSSSVGTPTGTVTVYVGGTIVGTSPLTGGLYSVTSTLAPASSSAQGVWAIYNGDGANHNGSDSRATTPGLTVSVTKATATPVLSVGAGPHTVGDTVTLTATFGSIGAGPTGTVTFMSGSSVLGTGTISGTTATLSYVVSATSASVTAEYPGNGNFTAATSAAATVTAAKAAPTVTISPITPHYQGEAFSLVADVTLPGGLVPAGSVEFRSGSGLVGTAVLVNGQAILPVCAGTCATGISLGTTAQSITAHYAETTISTAAQSSAASYAIARFATTMTFDVNPTTVQPNSGISLTATVDATDYTPAPTGSVSFYGLMPNGFGGFSEYFLVNVPLVNGIATKIVTVGDGLTDLRWPAEGVRAHYQPDPLFLTSTATTTVAVDRYDVSLSLYASSPVINAPTTIQVYVGHEPGTSSLFTEDLTVTADTGATCTVPAPFAGPAVSCTITWTTAGAHTVSASYDGDVIYQPASAGPVAVGFGTGTPALNPVLSANPVAEFDSTVHWSLFDGTATGTVTVWADGVLWCSVPIGDLQCTGQFGVAAATGAPVNVVVRYSGDTNWGPSETILTATVKRCVVPDVTSSNTSLGTVSISTPSNCGTGGYLSGTLLTATATAIAPNVFVGWKKLGGSGFVDDSPLATRSFTVTTDFMTWTRLAVFTTPCYAVTPVVTGRGGVSVYPAPNCTTGDGVSGYTIGTAISAYPDPAYNPQYGENDAFYSFGTAPGLTPRTDSSNRPYVAATVSGALSIPVTFGPVCRPVTVTFDSPSTGDAATVQPVANCHSPQGSGYTRFSQVAVTAVPGDPSGVITGWSLGGVPQPSWGASSTQSLVVGPVVPQLTVHVARCYVLDVTIDGVDEIDSFTQVGKVNVDVATNCPDGSARYLAGTKVTLTPEILVDRAAFTGWDTTRVTPQASAPGPLTDKALTFAMTANIAVTAGFFFADSCSSILVSAAPDVIAFEDDGCGQGQYFDTYKQNWLRSGETDPANFTDTTRTEIAATVNPAIPVDVFVSVLGDARNCFGNTSAGGAATTTDDGWTTYGPLTGRETCEVTGPIRIDVDTCQRFDAAPQFMSNGKLYPLSSIPTQLYLPSPNGLVGSMSLDDFTWMQSGTIGFDAAGSPIASNFSADPCNRSGADTYPVNRNVALYAYGPTDGFVATGWMDPSTGVPGTQNPVLTRTTTTAPSQAVSPVYTLDCVQLGLGSGITILGSPARCPGADPRENWFVTGTAVQVRAAVNADGRTLHGFKEGVVAGQIAEESESSKALIGFVVMDQSKRVTGDYPSNSEAVARALVQNLKVVVGVLAIMAPIALGMLFPPAGMFFAFLGAMAGIANMIPHGGPVASMFDLVNPTKITTCAARWGFTNSGDPTGGYGVGSLISGTNTLRKFVQGKELIFEKVGPLGMAGGAASLAYGLYEAGAGKVDLSPQTVEELAGTSTMTGCLNQQWKIVGANV